MTSAASQAPSGREFVASTPRYAPGRLAEDVASEWGLDAAIKLSSNESPFGPLPGVEDAVAAAIRHSHRYADHLTADLRTALADRHGLDPTCVAVGAGSVAVLQQLFLAYVAPGDHVVVPSPSFIAYPQFVALTGARCTDVPLRDDTIDAAAVAGAITEDTRLVVIANPNNPTGTALTAAQLDHIVDAAPSACLVVIDEAYCEYVTDPDVPDATVRYRERPNVAVTRTFSKAWSLASLRVGYVLADPTVVDAVDAALTPFNVNGLGQVAALAALPHHAEVHRRAAVVAAERDRIDALLRAHGRTVARSQANFWWLPMPGEAARAVAVALEQQGVVTRPLPSGLRITVGLPEENDAFLAALDHVRAPA
jgi:histidinol-phosphate aminotransferase